MSQAIQRNKIRDKERIEVQFYIRMNCTQVVYKLNQKKGNIKVLVIKSICIAIIQVFPSR